MPTLRQERVRELIREEVSRIILQELRDPRLGMVTVTDVEVSPDLRLAKVYVSIYGKEQVQQESLAALKGAAGFVRVQLGKAWTLRFLPELDFRLDESIERAARLSRLLGQVADEKKAE